MKKQTAASSLAVETAFPAAQTEYNIKKHPFQKLFFGFLSIPLLSVLKTRLIKRVISKFLATPSLNYCGKAVSRLFLWEMVRLGPSLHRARFQPGFAQKYKGPNNYCSELFDPLCKEVVFCVEVSKLVPVIDKKCPSGN